MSRYQGGIITKSPATPTGPTTTGRAPGIWRMDDVAYWTKQGLWPNANIQAPDASFPYVSLLLSTTALGNANNNLFVDSSGAFNPISRNGNTTQGSATPYGASWSNFFDGSGDYLTVPDNNALDFGTGDFTIEMWINAQNLSSVPMFFHKGTSVNTGWFFQTSGSTLYFGQLDSNRYSTWSVSLANNAWYHIALTRVGAVLNVFVNGVSQGAQTVTNANLSNDNTGLLYIGEYINGTYYYQGYLSNYRIVKGSAVYTSNFTVPTSNLTAISGTSLLTCQSNRFRDASTNNFTITVTGNTSVTDFSPFSPAYPGITYNQSDITNWSGYFDGSGDWLSAPINTAFAFGTGDFTMEAWVFRPATGNATIIAPGGGPGLIFYNTAQLQVLDTVTANVLLTDPDTFPLNQWVHVACARASGTMRLFVNGALKASGSVTNNFTSVGVCYVGSWDGTNFNWTGYISNARIVKGTAVYTSAFTPPTTNLTAISGTSLLTCQNAAFTDNSTNNFVITPNGNVTVTGNSPFNPVGYWSLYGPPTAGATVPQTTATDLGSGSFTVECWVNLQNYTTGGIVTKRRTDTALTGSWGIFITTSGFIVFQGVGWASTYTATTNAIPLNTWTHVAVSRSGTNLSVYVNGVRVINATDSYDYTCSTYMIIKLGGNAGGNYPSGGALNGGVTGSISNLRIVQGTAVYNPASTIVTVPTSPLTAISGTSFLTLQNGTMKDNSTNNNTSILLYNSAAAIQPFNPFYTATIASNGGSMYFDGSGDWLLSPSNLGFALGTGDFIVEVWANPSVQGGHGSGNNDCLIDFRSGNGGGAYGTLYLNSSGTYVGWYANTANQILAPGIPNNAWSHIVVSRVSGTTRMFINGVQSGSFTDSINYLQGRVALGQFDDGVGAGWFQGYMAGARIVKGSGVSANFTPPTAPVTPTANTTLLVNGMNAGAYDATAINDMETVGNAQVTTAVSKFGGSSVAFDGSGDGLKFPSNAPMSMGTGNFTWEFWVNPATASAGYKSIIDTRTATLSDGFFFGLNPGTLQLVVVSNVTVLTASTSLTANTWQHVALVRSSGTLTIYLGGTSIGSVANSTNLTSAAGTIGLSDSISNPNPFNGYIDDLRITRGVARYTANFTPPTQAFPTY